MGLGNFDVPFLYVDGQRLTRIRIGGYLTIPLQPGLHTVTVTESSFRRDTGKVRAHATFDVSQGEPVYIRYTERFGVRPPLSLSTLFSGPPPPVFIFYLVKEAFAQKELAETRRLELYATGE